MNLLAEIEKENQLLSETLMGLEKSFEDFKIELQEKEKEARSKNASNIQSILEKANEKLLNDKK